MIVTASAPGKLVLLGEYAVLEGAPAMVLAVNRRAEVTLSPKLTASDSGLCAIDAPGIIKDTADFKLQQDGTLEWRGVGSQVINRLRPVAHLLRALVSQGFLTASQLPGFTATLLTLNFFYRGQSGRSDKLGLGSSAALTVALAFALAEYAGFPLDKFAREKWLGLLMRAHRAMQGGQGSGLDVAASMWGGVIRYSLRSGTPDVQQIALPDDIALLFIWTGKGAATNDFLKAFQNWRDNKVAESAAMLRDMADISAAGLNAAKENDFKLLLETVAAYGAALRGLGKASGVDIYSAEHERINEITHDIGAIYKPCGAGGGDLGVALSNDPEALEHLRLKVEQAGFKTVGLQIDPQGARIDTRHQ